MYVSASISSSSYLAPFLKLEALIVKMLCEPDSLLVTRLIFLKSFKLWMCRVNVTPATHRLSCEESGWHWDNV